MSDFGTKRPPGSRADVNIDLPVFSLAPVIPYSGGIQQPMHAMAVMSSRPHTD
jgi:hypothetical protein